MQRRLFKISLACFGLVTPTMLHAQDAGAEAIANSETAGAASAVTGSQDIIVTGSRIARRDFDAVSPITTIGQETLQASGAVTIEASLNQLPQFAASAGSASNIFGRNGQASANLRGLGPQRTLVLVDGRRVQPANPDGSADLNAIPDALIEQVEVITGGASSTYGSDAVGGVVNFRLKRNFSGLQLDGQLGTTARFDGGTQSLKGIGGLNFADGRGNVVVALNYAKRDGIDMSKRSFFDLYAGTTSFPQGTMKVEANNLPTQAAVNAIFGRYGFAAGAVPRNRGFGFNTDGSLFVFSPAINYRDSTEKAFVNAAGGLNYAGGQDYLIRTPLERWGVFTQATFDITDAISVYGNFNYTDYTATTRVSPAVLGGTGAADVLVPVTNPFISPDLAELLASRPNPTAPISIARRLAETGQKYNDNHYKVFQGVLGLKGRFGGDWTWDVYASHGKTRLLVSEDTPVLTPVTTLAQASDGGRSICAGGFDPFGLSTLSDECLDYVMRTTRSRTSVSQSVAEANFQGGLFELPAGQVRVAFGAAWRKNRFDFSPDPLLVAKEVIGRDRTSGSGGSDEVYEAYAEILIPLLHDLPLIQQLDLNAGYRYSHYNSVGGVHTYKGDVDWRMTDSLRLRGGYSRAIRAPSVGEQFAGRAEVRASFPGSAVVGYGDPCDVRADVRKGAAAEQVAALCVAQGVPESIIDSYQNINARLIAITTGNPNLREETSDTVSAGAVWRPNFSSPLLSKFSLSVDYYRIAVKDAIGSVTTQVALNKCFNFDGSNPTYSPTDFYCRLVDRSSLNGLIDSVDNPALNLGGFRTSGIDVQLDWRFGLDAIGLGAKAGELHLNTIVNYLDKFEISTLPGAPYINYAGTNGNSQIDPLSLSKPRWKLTGALGYSVGAFQITGRYRYIDAQDNAVNAGTAGTIRGVEAVSYFDLDTKVTVNDGLEFRAGIINLFDRQPPQFGQEIGTTDVTTYDVEGRRFYLAARMTF